MCVNYERFGLINYNILYSDITYVDFEVVGNIFIFVGCCVFTLSKLDYEQNSN